jgi:SepF-like predicted cell division protein (DUF552 family)
VLILKFWKKEDEEEYLGSPYEAMGCSKEKDYFQVSSIVQKFLIKKYNFRSIEQIEDIKKQLKNRRILIINAKEILDSENNLLELQQAIEELKLFLKKYGGSIGRLGDQYIILTPSAHIKIAN